MIEFLATALARAAHLGYMKQRVTHEPLHSWTGALIASELRLPLELRARRQLLAVRAAFVAGWELSSRSGTDAPR